MGPAVAIRLFEDVAVLLFLRFNVANSAAPRSSAAGFRRLSASRNVGLALSRRAIVSATSLRRQVWPIRTPSSLVLNFSGASRNC